MGGGHDLFDDAPAAWQGRASELRSIANSSCWISYTLQILITQILHGMLGQHSRVPMPSLWCSLCSCLHCKIRVLRVYRCNRQGQYNPSQRDKVHYRVYLNGAMSEAVVLTIALIRIRDFTCARV
jgi:hypothetical protein